MSVGDFLGIFENLISPDQDFWDTGWSFAWSPAAQPFAP